MRRTFLLALVFVGGCASAPLRDYTAATTASEAQMRTLVEEKKIPGAAVAVVVGDRIVWHDTFGGGVTIETRFRVGSLTKLITAAALTRLVDDGRVALDDPVSKYLPDFPHGEITLRQLAGHLSGIRHYSNDEFINTKHYASATDALGKFASDPLLAKPGEKYVYSTYGFNVLGAVIEKITGTRFDEAVRTLVLRPLNMTGSSFADDALSAKPFDLGKTGPEPSPAVDLSDRLPAGALVTTARDLARFLIAMTNNHFLNPMNVETMFTSQATADGKATNVGIAWRIAKDAQGRTFVHHAGAATGGRSALALYPAERVGAIIVTNLGFAQFSERDAAEIARRFLDAK